MNKSHKIKGPRQQITVVLTLEHLDSLNKLKQPRETVQDVIRRILGNSLSK